MSVRASLSLGCEEAPLGGASEDYLTELTVEFRKTVRQSLPQPSWQPGTEFGGICRRRFGGALPGVGALFLLHRWCCARWCLSTPPRRTAWAHGAGSAPGRRRVSWRAGRCRGAPGPTELSAPRPVALATTSITGSLFFGGKKRGAKLGQDESSSTEALEQDETGRERELKGRFAPRLVALAAAICPDSKVWRKRSARGRRRASAPSLHTTRPPLARSTRAAPFRAHPPPRRRLPVLAAPCWGAQGPEHCHGNTKPGLACCPVGGGGGVDGHRFPCPLALCRAEKPGTCPHLMALSLSLPLSLTLSLSLSLSLSRERASRAFSSRALSSSCSRFIATELVERLSVPTASS